jgi:hypothetical protein
MLVPTNLPYLLQNKGLRVKVLGGWEGRGGTADHKAVVIHHTASSASQSPDACASYIFLGASIAPLYNILIDRTGTVWVGAREKSNNAGRISGTALNEVLAGKANLTPAAKRGLKDTTSNNGALFGISIQNNGLGEPYGPTTDVAARTAAVVLSVLQKSHAGYSTTHRALTARKPDPSGDACANDWHALINPHMGSYGGIPSGGRYKMVGIAATPTGKGYYQCAPDGGVFAFGDAVYHGSMGGKKLNAPIVDIAATPDGGGYAIVAIDGGVFTFGNCAFAGSTGGQKLNAAICGIEIDKDGTGYWLVAEDGGIFAFGAEFYGAATGKITPWSP